MATRYWVGGNGSQSFTATTNWSTTRNGASGASITSGDTLYILDGGSSIDSDLSNGGSSFTIYVGFNGKIGSTSAPLTVATNSDMIVYQCGGDLRIAGFDRNLKIYNTNGATCYVSNTNFASGEIAIGENATVVFEADAINMGTLGAYPAVGEFVIVGGAVTIVDGSVAGGAIKFGAYNAKIDCRRQIAQVELHGPQCFLNYSSPATANQIHVLGGSRYNHGNTATISNLYLHPGSVATEIGCPGGFTVSSAQLYGSNRGFFPNRHVPVNVTAETHIGWP